MEMRKLGCAVGVYNIARCFQSLFNLFLNVFGEGAYFITDSDRLFHNLVTLTVKLYFFCLFACDLLYEDFFRMAFPLLSTSVIFSHIKNL